MANGFCYKDLAPTELVIGFAGNRRTKKNERDTGKR